MVSAAYIRTSSLANAGEDKNSYARQLQAIKAYAKQTKKTIDPKHIYYDEGVSGTVPVEQRPQFKRMLTMFASAKHKVQEILVDEPSRLCRDLLLQEVTVAMLDDLGIKIIAVQSPEAFDGTTPTGVFMRQILGAVSQFQRSEVVTRLKQARDQALLETDAVTLAGKPKVVGKKNRLETNDGKRIKQVLKKWVKKASLERGDVGAARKALIAKGITTENDEDVSYSQVSTWLSSLRGETE
jgi:DNA invertase Pin-like site-specific DNA recombinase